MFAEIAINAPVNRTFDYAIPPELDGRLGVGHLVHVPFGTALQHGVVLALHETTTLARTKAVAARLDPQPALSPEQIDLARWISVTTLAPIGLACWLLLPPGLTGGRDVRVTLIDPQPPTADPVEDEVIALLRRRGTLRGSQLNTALAGKNWRAAVDALVRLGAVEKESILLAPRVRPKTVQTIALAIHPDLIEQAVAGLARPSRSADLLETIAQFDGAFLPTRAQRPTVDRLLDAGLIRLDADGTAALAIPPEQVAPTLAQLRKTDRPAHILTLLAREGGALDVAWVYAQTGAALADLKRLAEDDLVLLGEQTAWRDSLATRDYAAMRAPSLTPDQRAVWARLAAVIERAVPSPTPPQSAGEGLKGRVGYASTYNQAGFYKQLAPRARELRHEQTPAEARLWASLRREQIEGYKFRRQHLIGRYIADFFCAEAWLVIELDGSVHLQRADEDAYRQQYLEHLGLRVLRFTNDQVFTQHEAVIAAIRAALVEISQQPPPHPFTQSDAFASDAALSSSGEGAAAGGGLAQSDAFASDIDSALLPPPQRSGEGTGEGTTPSPPTFLLHGVTGSGKTEIYLRAIEATLAQGKSAIFLVPEIALTPQTLRRVVARFGSQVAVVHSGLSMGERYDTWRRAKDGLLRVIVGARSALFTPLRHLGLIILDEEHDHSYKQAESAVGLPPPYYHARVVAEEIARRADAVVILGSATPELETRYRADRGDIHLLSLPNRIMGHRVTIAEQAERAGVVARYGQGDAEDALMIDLPPVHLVDMRRELKAGNTNIFSRRLHAALNETLARREQTILFINRRGQSTYVFCRDCGYAARCPRCDTPLTHHRTGEALRCHRCGYETTAPAKCPSCSSPRIRFFGAGTQQVEQQLHVAFPQARTLRWDADTASTPDAHEGILQRFIDRKADILVGTQMIAKGLDLPLVTLVGVVSADLGLNLPDFRATERTFQTLTQVAGRAGRGLLGGQVILQTYQPEHYVIQAAAKHDYAAFYARELAYRRELGYPPFRRFVRVIFRAESEDRARTDADRAADLLRRQIARHNLTGTELIGPAPCFFTKVNRFFRWHILLRGPDPTVAFEDLDIPRTWTVDVDPMDVL